MLQRLFLIGFMLSVTIFLLGVINPATALSGIPECTGFAGEAAMKVVDGVTHLTYLNMENRVIYVFIRPNNTYVYHEVDTFNPGQMPILPTLELEDNAINIFYSKEGKSYKAVSTNEGADFTITEMESVCDVFPIVKKHDGLWRSFLTPNDTYADSSYQYFSNIDRSTNDTTLPFWGPDVVNGAVRSNTDIWVKQAGGGANNGWPTFYRPVYTSGQIQSYSGTPPYNQVFQGGLYEHVPALSPDLQTMKWQIQNEGGIVYQSTQPENKIVFVTVYGSTYSSMVGTIIEAGADTMDVWSEYPPRNGSYLFRNMITKRDTIWTSGPSASCSGRTQIVNAPLWIKGTFSGKQTWYSPYGIMICDDIRLSGTPMGQVPDMNNTDYVALVTDGKIEVQYGYKEPADSVRYKPNCGSDADGVYIYASLYALHDDPTDDPHKDGCFTFEYQHPHPSTPAVVLPAYPDWVWDQIDLHRYKYPQTESQPWPGNIDYPYYNPLWPERLPTMERGTIHLYGSVYQQRRGFMHRSTTDSEYPNPNNRWDIENDYCGSTSGASVFDAVLGFAGQGVNAIGATGSGVGYKKDYHSDTRLNFNTFSFNPFGLGLRYKTSINGDDWSYKYFKSLNEPVSTKTMCFKAGKTAMQLNNHILWQETSEANVIMPEITLPFNERLQGIRFFDDNNLMLNIYSYSSSFQDSVRLVKLNPVTNETQVQYSLPVISKINTLYNNVDGLTCFANLEANGTIRIYAPDLTGNLQSWTVWNPQIAELAGMQIDLEKSRLAILSGNADSLYVILALANLTGGSYNLYCAKGVSEYTHNQDITEPELVITTKIYPNPFKQNLTLSIDTNKQVEADVSVYNVKGQLVKRMLTHAVLSKGEHSYYWDGKDQTGKQSSNGIYFMQGNVGTGKIADKVLLLK